MDTPFTNLFVPFSPSPSALTAAGEVPPTALDILRRVIGEGAPALGPATHSLDSNNNVAIFTTTTTTTTSAQRALHEAETDSPSLFGPSLSDPVWTAPCASAPTPSSAQPSLSALGYSSVVVGVKNNPMGSSSATADGGGRGGSSFAGSALLYSSADANSLSLSGRNQLLRHRTRRHNDCTAEEGTATTPNAPPNRPPVIVSPIGGRGTTSSTRTEPLSAQQLSDTLAATTQGWSPKRMAHAAERAEGEQKAPSLSDPARYREWIYSATAAKRSPPHRHSDTSSSVAPSHATVEQPWNTTPSATTTTMMTPTPLAQLAGTVGNTNATPINRWFQRRGGSYDAQQTAVAAAAGLGGGGLAVANHIAFRHLPPSANEPENRSLLGSALPSLCHEEEAGATTITTKTAAGHPTTVAATVLLPAPKGQWCNDMVCREYARDGVCKLGTPKCGLYHLTYDERHSYLAAMACAGHPVRFCLRYLRHQEDPTRGSPPCKTECAYFHGTKEQEATMIKVLSRTVRPGSIPEALLCRSYLTNGKCKYGSECHYLHPRNRDLFAATLHHNSKESLHTNTGRESSEYPSSYASVAAGVGTATSSSSSTCTTALPSSTTTAAAAGGQRRPVLRDSSLQAKRSNQF